MSHELMSMGYVISGPASEHFVFNKDEIEPLIKQLSTTEHFDEDDYTATEVYAVAFRGAIYDMPHPRQVREDKAAIEQQLGRPLPE